MADAGKTSSNVSEMATTGVSTMRIKAKSSRSISTTS
jgi:hypothetical protein